MRSVFGSRIGAGSCSVRVKHGARGEAQRRIEHRGAAIGALETLGQRLEQPRQHERQRLEPFDRPLELERGLERNLIDPRHHRPRIHAARERLPQRAALAEPFVDLRTG